MNKEKTKFKVTVTYAPMSKEREEQAARIISEMLLMANVATSPETEEPALTGVATGYILREVQGANP